MLQNAVSKQPLSQVNNALGHRAPTVLMVKASIIYLIVYGPLYFYLLAAGFENFVINSSQIKLSTQKISFILAIALVFVPSFLIGITTGLICIVKLRRSREAEFYIAIGLAGILAISFLFFVNSFF
jgi:hypothetical protein